MGRTKKKSGSGPAAKKKSKAKSKKHVMRSATYAAKKLIDSAIAAGAPAEGDDETSIDKRKKKAIRRAAAAAARLFEIAIAEDTEGARPAAVEADGDGDGASRSRSSSDASMGDADDPLDAMAAQGSAFAAKAIADALRTSRLEAQATALLEGLDFARVPDAPAPPDAVFLEDACIAAGYEYCDESAERWAEFWASRPTVVGIDAEGTHFEPPLLLQVCANTSKRVLLIAPAGNHLSPDAARLLADPGIVKCFFGRPRDEKLGCDIARAVDAQALEIAHTDYVGKTRGLAAVAGDRLRGAPYSKRKELQRSFGFYRGRPDPALAHSRHWLSQEQRAYAAADAWATLALYEKLVADGAAAAPRDVPARSPPSPPRPPKATKADALRALARGR